MLTSHKWGILFHDRLRKRTVFGKGSVQKLKVSSINKQSFISGARSNCVIVKELHERVIVHQEARAELPAQVFLRHRGYWSGANMREEESRFNYFLTVRQIHLRVFIHV